MHTMELTPGYRRAYRLRRGLRPRGIKNDILLCLCIREKIFGSATYTDETISEKV